MQLLLPFVFLPVVSGLLGFIGTKQRVSVTGRLTCNGQPANAVKLKLYDVNTFTLDTFMDQKYSNFTGGFYLSGSSTSVSTIKPKLNIYHKCNYNGLCYKKLAIKIPKQFVTSNKNANYFNVFNAGQIELAGSFSGQSIDCLNK